MFLSYDPVSIGKKYLNSGLFIGYAPELYKMISSSSISPEDSDQLFFTQIYVNDTLKEKLNIKIDHRSTLFQTMHGVPEDVQITFKGLLNLIGVKFDVHLFIS